MLTGQAHVDLTEVDPDRMKMRLAGVTTMPSGAKVSIRVGALNVEPEVCWLLHEHQARLDIVVEGEPWNVPRWLDAIRSNLGKLPL